MLLLSEEPLCTCEVSIIIYAKIIWINSFNVIGSTYVFENKLRNSFTLHIGMLSAGTSTFSTKVGINIKSAVISLS